MKSTTKTATPKLEKPVKCNIRLSAEHNSFVDKDKWNRKISSKAEYLQEILSSVISKRIKGESK
jgi:hypothetical protein